MRKTNKRSGWGVGRSYGAGATTERPDRDWASTGLLSRHAASGGSERDSHSGSWVSTAIGLVAYYLAYGALLLALVRWGL